LVPTNTAGKTERQGIGSNQYGGKLISTNTEKIFCGKQFQPKWRDIGSNQYGRKLVPTNTAGKEEQQGIGSNQYGGKLIPNNTVGN
jgi:hypothetical protein